MPGTFSIVLISDAAMCVYNSRYRGQECPTDVLSFPYEREGWSDAEPYLGDILISVESAQRQKRGTLEQELQVLCLHGLLHLMGYDHEKDRGEMNAFENHLKEEFGLP